MHSPQKSVNTVKQHYITFPLWGKRYLESWNIWSTCFCVSKCHVLFCNVLKLMLWFPTGISRASTLYCKPYAHWTLEIVSQKIMGLSSPSDPWLSGRKHLIPVTGSNAAAKLVLKTGLPMILWAMTVSVWGKWCTGMEALTGNIAAIQACIEDWPTLLTARFSFSLQEIYFYYGTQKSQHHKILLPDHIIN